MATEVRLPKLGQTMEEGTIVNCLVKVGDQVKRGDVIFEVETDKAALEMESPADGIVKSILVNIGQTIPVGDVIMVLGGKDEKIEAAEPSAKTETPKTSPKAKTAEPAKKQTPVTLPESLKVVNLPKLGQTMEEGTIVNCMVKVGDSVKRGEVIFEVETDKAALEMESPAEGFVKFILAEVGQTLPVGEPMLILAGKDEQVPQSVVDSLRGSGVKASAEPVAKKEESAAPSAKAPAGKKTGGRVIASPRAKMLAAKNGVNLAGIAGSGPGGRIIEADVKAVSGKAAPVSAAPLLGKTIPLNRLQKITGERMLKSKQEIPCFYLNVKADVTKLVEFRTRINSKGDVKIAYNDIIIKAVATGLEKFPVMTGQLAGDVIKLADSIGIGLAISVEDGLVAPIVKDVNKKNLRQIALDTQALIEKARNNKLAPMDLSGGCITVTNLGAFGIESFIPIVVPGQCSILGIGQISDTCVPENGNLMVKKLMCMTLSTDHKVANGAYAAQFLDFVRKTLENPSNFE